MGNPATDVECVRRWGLLGFVEAAWPAAGETDRFLTNWHLAEICRHLEAVSRGDLRRLCINVPPGCSKSLLTCVLWPAWDWIEHPTRRWIFGTYGQRQTLYHARRFRDLVTSQWYQDRWPRCILGTAAEEISTSNGGFRYSTSVGGAVTGRHGDILVADDISKVQDAYATSGISLEGAVEWWDKILSTRQSNPSTTARVLIGQRIAEGDVFGALQDPQSYTTLVYPMRGPASPPSSGDVRMPGELLWPGRYPEAEVESIERSLGPLDAAAQLQQEPTPPGGSVIQGAWLHPYKRLPRGGGRLIQSWDLAFKGSINSDHVVGGVLLASGEDRYLVEVVRGQWDFTETCRQMLALTERYPETRNEILVEDKANGAAVENHLRGILPGIRLVNPQGGKLSRVNSVLSVFASNHFFVPEYAPWLTSFVSEITRFTGRGNEVDDQVDMVSQGLLYLSAAGRGKLFDALEKFRKRAG